MKASDRAYPLRLWVVAAVFATGFVLMGARAYYLQVVHADWLQRQGNARQIRTVDVSALRGMILDRNGEPLAISTPVESVWANPAEFDAARSRWPALARVLQLDPRGLADLTRRHAEREFMYLKRHVPPEVAAEVQRLNVPGVYLRREYKRYYPAGSVTAHVVGFTDVDDHGQEGLELAHDEFLRGRDGRKLVLKDGRRMTIKDLRSLRRAEDGHSLVISLDSRLQYLAYRALQSAVAMHGARAGSLVLLDARSGEVLAMVNEPGFNPNNRAELKSGQFRNRAVTDLFEPGSTIKPFTIAAAIDDNLFHPDTRIETDPGYVKVGSHTIRDEHNYGRLTVARVIIKSSNVGASKIAMAMPAQQLWKMLDAVGCGHSTAIDLPGENTGRLAPAARWRELEQATLSFGYGLSLSPLQLAQAYTALANDGRLVPVTMLRREGPVHTRPVMKAVTAHEIGRMLELAASEQGTGGAARVARYRVAGKTGTVHKIGPGGYSPDRYVSIFAGYAPVSDPRLVAVVVIDDPERGGYFGGEVAAPVFAQVMDGALRLLNIPPDGTGATVATGDRTRPGGGNG